MIPATCAAAPGTGVAPWYDSSCLTHAAGTAYSVVATLNTT
jgi:hypothetical protein